jgi:mxaJ protein
MPRYGFLLLAAFCFCSLDPARSEMSGREKIEAAKSEFRVCADPDNLPFSNRQGEGFGNKIAELLARASGEPLVYYWWPQRRGFINKTLNAWECDVVLDVPTGYDLTRTTQPYYCSQYVAVYRPGEHPPSLFNEPQTQPLRIGVVEHTPPLDMVLQQKLDPVVYFSDYDYVSNYPGRIVADVANGKLDVALVWGPIGGHFARQQSIPLRVAALEQPRASNARLTFPVSFGVRRGDKARAERLEALAREHADEIATILRESGVPLVDDPAQCAAPHLHAAGEPAASTRLAADVSSKAPAAHIQPVADRPAPPQSPDKPQSEAADQIKCDGPETMEKLQKFAGRPETGHPYVVQDGKVDPTTYSGWIRFSAFCQVCHGVGGVGSAIAPDLDQAVKNLDKDQFEHVVSCGLRGNLGTGVMPAWGDNPNIKPYINDLWAYLRARADGVLGAGRPQKLSSSSSR